MDIRSLQRPLKEQYRNDPNASRIMIRAKGGQTDVPVSCSVDIGRAVYNAEAHQGDRARRQVVFEREQDAERADDRTHRPADREPRADRAREQHRCDRRHDRLQGKGA